MQSVRLNTLVDVQVVIDATNREATPIRPGSHFSFPIRLTNVGDRSLEWSDPHPLNVSYRWLSEEGEVLERDGRRTVMPVERLLPGERHELQVRGEAPSNAGLYHLQVSLVLEGVHWACDVSPTGWSTVALQLVPAPVWPEALLTSVGGRAIRGALIASEFERLLDRHSFSLKLLVGVGADDLHRSRGSVLGSDQPTRKPWRGRISEWFRDALGMAALQRQVDEVLEIVLRQEHIGRELESQILSLREDLAAKTDPLKKRAPDFNPSVIESDAKPGGANSRRVKVKKSHGIN